MLNSPPGGRPGPSVQEIFASDPVPPPPLMRVESPATGLGSADVSIERYFDKGWHDREIDRVWRKTWQLACRVEPLLGVPPGAFRPPPKVDSAVVRLTPLLVRVIIGQLR